LTYRFRSHTSELTIRLGTSGRNTTCTSGAAFRLVHLDIASVDFHTTLGGLLGFLSLDVRLVRRLFLFAQHGRSSFEVLGVQADLSHARCKVLQGDVLGLSWDDGSVDVLGLRFQLELCFLQLNLLGGICDLLFLRVELSRQNRSVILVYQLPIPRLTSSSSPDS
jgi:hypothetical protein